MRERHPEPERPHPQNTTAGPDDPGPAPLGYKRIREPLDSYTAGRDVLLSPPCKRHQPVDDSDLAPGGGVELYD